jgi:formylglycine-generating enzyme required for sulfatase activity
MIATSTFSRKCKRLFVTSFFFASAIVSHTPTTLAVTIELVPVGNAGNAPDTRYNSAGVGSVPYDFRIAKYEVTAGQYTEFLNAVAKDDTNGVYSSLIGLSEDGPKIEQTGSSPNYSYSVAAAWANRPVNYVSFWDAVRFANWLHNGQPTGAQGPGTTEDGAYHNIGDLFLFGRSPDAKFFIPTENEWYQAAYHKNDGVTGNYWDYPTSSNIAPLNTLPDPGNHANFWDGTGFDGYTVGAPYYRTEVGAFANSAGPYETFDQAGNVYEWTDSTSASSSGIQYGGSYAEIAIGLHASWGTQFDRWRKYAQVGFRVANIPEPNTCLLGPCILVIIVSLTRRQKRFRSI